MKLADPIDALTAAETDIASILMTKENHSDDFALI